jgi:hypothetical protein
MNLAPNAADLMLPKNQSAQLRRATIASHFRVISTFNLPPSGRASLWWSVPRVEYVFSVTSQSFSSSSPSSSLAADRGGLPGWKRDELRKQPERASLVPPRKTAEDDHEDEDEDVWGMTLNTYRVETLLSPVAPFGA